MRNLLINLHKWLGFGLLLVLMFQATTGVLLTYDHAIDEFLNPTELRVNSGLRGEYASVDNILHSVYTNLPDVVAISSLRKPRHTETVFVVYPTFSKGSEYHGRKMEVLLNPYTAEITGIREWGKYFTSFVYSLHSTLLLNDIGKVIIGWLGILLLTSLIIGLYLAWPKTINTWRFYFSRSVAQLKHSNYWRKKHVQIGLILAPFLCVTFLTGVGMSFHKFTSQILNVPEPQILLHIDASRTQPQKIESLLTSIKADLPEYEWQRIKVPSSPYEPVLINLKGGADPRRSVGSSNVWVDITDGKLIDSIKYDELSLRQKISFWLFPLHNGEVFNHVGKLLIILTGFATMWLVVTAFLRFVSRKHFNW
ncbi:MAG TPA: PepSY domain-containing protein [Methylophaga aminisulfidivorans]|uniref:PepSY-associated TM helix domain-containing protein n=1 Tax=Methylophaga TaxID=40222 RepID=UPI001771E532|nr:MULTISPECIES: PepSY-associated TM helix domain-containing protein [Methylophaga]HIC47185.1 PepSY domain-containing protein [Methylophaga sp.]HIM40174.1 PepSY domain-containing protein [Methylophaga aminisulfidivorans]